MNNDLSNDLTICAKTNENKSPNEINTPTQSTPIPICKNSDRIAFKVSANKATNSTEKTTKQSNKTTQIIESQETTQAKTSKKTNPTKKSKKASQTKPSEKPTQIKKLKKQTLTKNVTKRTRKNAESSDDETCKVTLSAGSKAVIKMVENLKEGLNYKVFYDNWFSSPDLAYRLLEKGIHSTATVQIRRVKGISQ